MFVDYSITFSILAFTEVLAKVDDGLTDLSPAVIVDRSCFNWSSVMSHDCVLSLEYAIDKESLVLALDFCYLKNGFKMILVGII